MAPKQIIYGDDARDALLKGIIAVNTAVVTTLGPKGRNVAIEKRFGAPIVIHDGVTVAKEIELPDPFQNMGAQLVKEASSKTNDAAGDGTTTSTLLASIMSLSGMRYVNAKANPMTVKKGMEMGVAAVVSELKKMARPINKESDAEIEQVAVVSAGDEHIGKKIAEAIKNVGADGVITVEEGKGLEIEIEYKEGMEFDRGYMSSYFVTNPERMEAEIENAYILLTDKKIASVQDLLPFLEKFVKVSKTLVIIADDIEGEALTTLVLNKLRGAFNVLAIKAPGFGDRRKDLLSDIADLTGGTVISDDTGRTFESVEIEDLGRADKVWAGKDTSKIIGGKGNKKQISSKISLLKNLIESTTNDFDREKLEERLAKLAGGVAVINVGAATEVELNDKKERVKDAVGATKAAIQEGILPGGGVALLKARKVLKDLKSPIRDVQFGIDIIYEALEYPLRVIIKNAGEDDGYVLRVIEDTPTDDWGYNVLTNEFGSMLAFGLLDPLKVTRSALQNAASVAMMVLTTEALVAEIPQPEKAQAANPNMGGMDY